MPIILKPKHLLLVFALIIFFYNAKGATLYSYQSGNWNIASTWTTDPSGTTQVGSGIPANGDIIVILESRTVTLTADVANTNLDITINSGAYLDLKTLRFTNTLTALRGEGTLQLATVNFPAATTNTFVNAGGGTTEYNNTASFTFSQATYNNLTLNLSTNAIIATQLINITLNGNLYVKTGIYRIGNNSSTTKRNLTISGNVLVDNGASITVGNGSTNNTTSPLSISTTLTAPFIDYYEQFHRVVINGDFINNGTVRFTNLAYPVFDAFPPLGNTATSGAASVYFQGASNNIVRCNGTTDFYNLIIDKGTDQTYSLTVYSTAYQNFRLFGANIAGGNGGGSNPNLKKALWIRTGTLVLQGLTIIPSLSEGTCAAETPAADPNTDFYIPANAALVLDGPDVIVLSTADDYREVNVAYNVSGGTGLVNGVGLAGCSSYSIFGKLQINDGYFSTRESGGFITWDNASGEFIINGGIVDAKQFRAAGGAGGLASFTQTGGLFLLRGRFQRTPTAYSTISNLIDVSTSTLNTVRANEGSLEGVKGTFNINAAANVYSMSGGTIRIYDVCREATANYAFQVNSDPANINVTGGTVELIPTSGTVTANVDLPVSTTAPIYNLTIARSSGTQSVILNTDITVLNDLSITSGIFNANNYNVTIDGDYNLAAATTYTPGANTTTFDGAGNNTFTLEGTITTGFNSLVIDKNDGSLTVSRIIPSTFAVSNTFDLLSGTFNDGGNTFNVAGNVTNSGIHTGTGTIRLNGTTSQTIGGDGTGIFQNLTLNNTNGAAASSQISLTADITVNGILNLSNDRIFNIGSYRLSLGASSTLTGTFGANRFIATDGNAGDKGISKTFSTNSFSFPIGVIPTAVRYTPTTITFSTTPTTYGTVSITPVDAEQMQTSKNGKNRSLTYFWRVRSSGFTLGSANVSQTFNYAESDVYTPTGNVTEVGYVPARYNPLTFTWNKGTAANVNETTNMINWPNNVNYIDGDYTAGDDDPQDPFGAVEVFYSYQSGAWRNNTTWMTDTTDVGTVTSTDPDQNTPVMIRNGHIVTCDQNANTCGSLQIQSTGILDCGTYTGLNFGVVSNHVRGSGKIRISSTAATAVFPSGDFSDFLSASGGTIEYYTPAGSSFTIPTATGSGDALGTYRHLINTPATGRTITMPDRVLTIYGNFTSQGVGTGTTRLNTANSRTLFVNGNLNITSGVLEFRNGRAQTITVLGNVAVSTGATFQLDNNAGTTNTMNIWGNLVNNGTFDMNRGSVCNINFLGDANKSVSGTATLTEFYNVSVNKGTSQATTLTFTVGGTLTTPTDNWLTLQNGTLRYMRTNPSSDFTISAGTEFTIPGTAGLYVDYSNSGSRNILIANSSSDANDLFLNGKLTIVQGNVYLGPTTFPSNNNDIEYSGAGFSEIDVQGGNLFVNGQIRRNPATNAGILIYNQSGGNVTINGQAAITTNAKLEILNQGSVFNMSNGTLTIVRGGGGTTFGDLYLRPETSSVTGGTIVFSQGTVDAVQTYSLDASVPLNNLTITGKSTGTTRNATVNLMVNPLVLNGNLTLTNTQSILTSNNIDVYIKGNFTNNGTYNYGTNLTTFNGNTQSITGSSTTNFYDLTVSPVSSLTLSRDITVNRNLVLDYGTLICGSYTVNLKGNFTNNATYTNTGNGVIMNGTALQHLAGTGTFGRLELNNSAGAKLDNALTLQSNLVMTTGIFDINQFRLTLGVNSSVIASGTAFSATKMITSEGVFSDVGIRKFFNAGATTFTYPIGVTGKYTPAILTITANDNVGSIRVNTINDRHPAVSDPANVLKYYWEVESNSITGFAGSLVLSYLQADVQGTQEANYVAARLIVPGVDWSKAATGSGTDNVNETANTITFTYPSGTANLSGEYTAGTDAAIPNTVQTYTSNGNGNWTNVNAWTPTAPAGGPNGFIIVIRSSDTINMNADHLFAYRTTINGKLKAINPYYGHNLGTVSGSGILYLENGNLPAGRFTSFFDCSTGGTLQYGGTGSYTLVADRLDVIPKLWFIGSGTRVLPNKDLTICNQLLINGPTLDNSVNNRKLTIQGTFERYNTGTFNSGTGAGATVTFAGSSAQNLGGSLGNFTSPNNEFNNLEIDNDSGLTLGGATDVNGLLLLTSGNITTTTSNILRILNTSTSCVTPSGGSSSSYVNGPLVKTVNQGDYFLFPIGKGTELGNQLTLSASRTGTLNWTAEYFVPNSTSSSFVSPLTSVDPDGFWTLSSTAGSEAKVKINWEPTSGLTPLMTNDGVSGMRVSQFYSSNWNEIASTSSGNEFNGYSETSSRVTLSSGSGNFTLACTGSLKARAMLDPLGPVCGTAGIPVTFSSSVPINFNYTLSYTIDGFVQTPVTVSSLPYVLPTPSSGTYQLTGFTYNNGASTGVVDVGTVNVYDIPTTANAGTNQTGAATCGATSTTLAGNTPVLGSGLWTIVTGTGGTINSPTSPSSNFSGTNGSTYVLRWTISNGSCTSSSDMTVTFNLLPSQPDAFIVSSSPVCQGQNSVTYTVPIDATVSYSWSYDHIGTTINGTSNSVTIDFSSTAASGTLSVSAINGCGTSAARTTNIIVNPLPSQPAAFTTSTSSVCVGQSGVIYTVPNDATVTYSWSYSGTGATINGTSNSVSIDFGPAAIDGTLSVTAINSCGTSSSRDVSITVNPVTSISTQSTSGQTRCTNSAFDPISVTASGTGTLTYQWYSNTSASTTGGTLISGSTSASYTPLATTAGTLYYYCTVHSNCGSDVTSAVSGAFIVNPLPVPSLAGNDSICVGTTVIYTTDGGMSNYSWTIPAQGIVVGASTNNTININWQTYTNLGSPTSISITYTDTNGCNPAAAKIMNIMIFKVPETGPEYHIKNNW